MAFFLKEKMFNTYVHVLLCIVGMKGKKSILCHQTQKSRIPLKYGKDAINIFTTKSVIKDHVITLECQQCNGRNRMSITHGNGRVHYAWGVKVKTQIIFQMFSTLKILIDRPCLNYVNGKYFLFVD